MESSTGGAGMTDDDDRAAFAALVLAALEALSSGVGMDLGDDVRPLED
jgi:hypothetical protein